MPKAAHRVFAAALFLAAGGCAGFGRPKSMDWALPAPEAAPFEARKTQDVELVRGGSSSHFLAVLERQEGRLVLVGLDPLGRRLLRVVWSGQGLEADVAPQAARYLDAGLILRELVFAQWPSAALQQALAGSPWSAEFSRDRRVLLRAGDPWLTVERKTESGGSLLVLKLRGQDGEVRVRDLEEAP